MRTVILLSIVLTLSSCAAEGDPTATTNPAVTTQVDVSSPPGDPAETVHVFDGDSLLVAIGGTEHEIRLIGVNAPEGEECHGDVSRATLEQLLATGPLTVVSAGEDADQYGRLLRYLYVDGLNVNLALIANGDAVALQGDHALDSEFATIADAAAEAGLGMWAPDACGDVATSSLEIVDYVYNPSGRDEANMNGEWIAIGNAGSDSVDVSGWVLRDESTRHRFRFPYGYSIASGREVIVHSGCGEDTATDLYWCADDPVWSNGGDTVILQNQDGTVMARDRFAGEY